MKPAFDHLEKLFSKLNIPISKNNELFLNNCYPAHRHVFQIIHSRLFIYDESTY